MFTVDKNSLKKDREGRVYVFKLELNECVVYKVGICGVDRAYKRFFEVLEAFHKVYRYVPKAKMLKFKKFHNARLVEKHLHEELKEYNYRFDKRFNGSTEFFTEIDVDYLLTYIEEFTYDLLLDCSNISTVDYDAIYKELPATDYSDEFIPF